MTAVAPTTAEPADPLAAPAGPAGRRRPGNRRWDAAVAASALALAAWVTSGLWSEVGRRTIGNNSGDHAFFEWLLGYGAHVLRTGADPYFATVLNAPDGVNLAANTSITVYIIVFAPITMLFGPSVSYVLILTLNLAASAFAWYWLLSRYVVQHPGAAAVAGMFAGFAPGYVSHANGHLNWTAGWIAPVLLARVLTLGRPGRWLRNGVILGLLVAVAFTTAAEGLFFTALACGLFLGTWALHPATRSAARTALPTVLKALGVTAAVAGTLLAYPLWMHFAGPRSFSGTGFNQEIHSEDVAAYAAWPDRSLAGLAGLARDLAPNPTEETSFFGVPLLLLVGACLVWLWWTGAPGRRATLSALAITGVVFTVLSWGPRLKLAGQATAVQLPYTQLAEVPLFDAALPARLSLVVAGVIAVVLAFAADRLLTAPPRLRWRAAWIAGFVAALLPLVPVPLRTAERSPIPDFITAGTWRRYVPPGGGLTALPMASDTTPDGQRWQAHVLAAGGRVFTMPDGYFLGPGGPDGRGRIGAPHRYTDQLFTLAAHSGEVPFISDADRVLAEQDFHHWGVSVVVLADQVSGTHWPVHYDAVRDTAVRLLGPPRRVDDVWLWQVG